MHNEEEQNDSSGKRDNDEIDHVDFSDDKIEHVDFSDALLWSDCPEELYLQNILSETEHRRSQQKENSNDSLMGDSTIENLLVPPKGPGKIRRTIDWAPIAGSRATEDSPRDSEMSGPASGIKPLRIDFNEAASSVATDPEMVVEFDATEFDATATMEMEKTRLSSLSGDTWFRMIRPAANFTHAWIPAENVSLARQAAPPSPPAASTKKPPLVVYTPSTKQSSIKIGEGSEVDEEDQGVHSSGPCCGFLCRAREDGVFRRLINLAVCLLVAFVVLATTAVIMSTTNMFTSETAQDASGYNNAGEMITAAPSPSPTVAPSPSPAPSSSNISTDSTSSPSDTSTPPPTTQPTPQPTSPPTRQPTAWPTPPPVVDPTPKPTRIPVAAPTQQPHSTASPTTFHPSSSERPLSPHPTLFITIPPSTAPTGLLPPPFDFEDHINSGAEYNRIIEILRQVASDSTLESIEEQSSPQFHALVWLVWDLQQQPSLPDSRVIQRWVLAVLFFSMDGPEWIRLDGWMTTANECQWFTTSSRPICDDDGAITHLDLEANNLGGTIPEEIAILSDSLERLFLNSNERISGHIPRSFGSLSNLERLHLTVNNIQGSIPAELGDLENLEMLALGRNDISGTIPSSLASLRRLRLLDLAVNSIFGTIPSSLGRLRRLTKLTVTSNDLSGTVPSDLSSLTRLSELKLRDNFLVGSIPSEICGISTLEVLEVSCEEVLCSCCENCT